MIKFFCVYLDDTEVKIEDIYAKTVNEFENKVKNLNMISVRRNDVAENYIMQDGKLIKCISLAEYKNIMSDHDFERMYSFAMENGFKR